MNNKMGEMQDVLSIPVYCLPGNPEHLSVNTFLLFDDFKRSLYEHDTEVLLLVNTFNVLLLPVLLLTETFCIFNPLNPKLNPMCCLLALLGAHHFLHVSRIRVKSLTFRRLMSYIYGAPILDVSRSHTTTQHSR